MPHNFNDPTPVKVRSETLAERLERRSEPGPGGCRLWTGVRVRGYGQIAVEGRMRGAHRVALELALGRALGPDEDATHTCDVPACIEPSHLRPANASQNALEAVARGRWALGERHPRARLTTALVAALRAGYGASGATIRSLALDAGVSPVAARAAIRGRSWKWLSEPAPIPGPTRRHRKRRR